MDTLRAHYSDHRDDRSGGESADDDETGRELPPVRIGQDERRMHVRAYNFWASRLDNRQFPCIDELEPENLPDFGPHGVLLDFSTGIEDPCISYIGAALAEECGPHGAIRKLSDIPGRSLLSRITDHYMQILANQAPIGFEAEFSNWRGATILYRGILLPFSSDNESIDHIFGVINWKELADHQVTEELQLQMEQSLEPQDAQAHDTLRHESLLRDSPLLRDSAPLTVWADGPAEAPARLETAPRLTSLPVPDFGFPVPVENELALEVEFAERPVDPDEMGLADWLASARELALGARACEDRSRQALYAALGRAHDFALAAADNPDEARELFEDAGIAMQARSPFTPLVKLVFGADYDKTRLAEYATVLGYAQRTGLGVGTLADHLASTTGGLKAIVAEERRLRRAQSARPPRAPSPGKRLAERLRQLESRPLAAVRCEGSEFALLVTRRLPDGEVVLLGEVADDPALLERASRRLL